LDQLVHTDKEVGEYINARYISVKMDGNSAEGKQLRNKYKYPGYPTTILMTANGEEIDRIVGFSGNKDEHFQLLKDYAEGRNTLGDYLKKLENEPKNFDYNYAVLRKYSSRNDYQNIKKYAGLILQLDPENNQGKKTEMSYHLAFSDYKISGLISPMLDFTENCKDEDWLEAGYSEIIRYYQRKPDQSQVMATYESAVKRLQRPSSLMNSYAWYIFQNKIADRYSRGIEVARRAVELSPDADHIWDTLAQLLFADGQIDEAIKAMQKAAEIDPKEESYRDLVALYLKTRTN